MVISGWFPFHGLFFCSIAAVSIPFFICELGIISPVRRGFFCNDSSISYPLQHTETISDTVLLIVGVLTACIVVSFEGMGLIMLMSFDVILHTLLLATKHHFINVTEMICILLSISYLLTTEWHGSHGLLPFHGFREQFSVPIKL